MNDRAGPTAPGGIHTELQADGIQVGRKRCLTWSSATSWHRDPIGCGWLTFTYIPTRAGFLYRAVVLDAFSRRAGDGDSAAHRAGARSIEHGARAATARQGDLSFRPRHTVDLDRLRDALPRGWRAAVDGLGQRLLRRHVRDFFAAWGRLHFRAGPQLAAGGGDQQRYWRRLRRSLGPAVNRCGSSKIPPTRPWIPGRSHGAWWARRNISSISPTRASW